MLLPAVPGGLSEDDLADNGSQNCSLVGESCEAGFPVLRQKEQLLSGGFTEVDTAEWNIDPDGTLARASPTDCPESLHRRAPQGTVLDQTR